MKIKTLLELANQIENKETFNKIINCDLLMNKSDEEKEKIFQALKTCKYNEKAIGLAVNRDVLKLRTTEEQIKLIEAIKACEYNEKASLIAINRDVLEKRTIEEQIKLIEAIKACRYDNDSFELAIKRDVLATKTIEEQIDLMKKAIPFLSYTLLNIESLEELREYLKELSENEVDVELSSKPKCKDKTIFRKKKKI